MLHLLHGLTLSFIFLPDIFEKVPRYSYLLQVFHLCLNKLVDSVIHDRNISTTPRNRSRPPTERQLRLILIILKWLLLYLVALILLLIILWLIQAIVLLLIGNGSFVVRTHEIHLSDGVSCRSIWIVNCVICSTNLGDSVSGVLSLPEIGLVGIGLSPGLVLAMERNFFFFVFGE